VASIFIEDVMRTGPLQPYVAEEAIGTAAAAGIAGRSERTVRNWCLERKIGRRIGGRWAVSVVALDMVLAGDEEALAAYLRGERDGAVSSYYEARAIQVSSAPAPQPAPPALN
jgi:hypothetical protein